MNLTRYAFSLFLIVLLLSMPGGIGVLLLLAGIKAFMGIPVTGK